MTCFWPRVRCQVENLGQEHAAAGAAELLWRVQAGHGQPDQPDDHFSGLARLHSDEFDPAHPRILARVLIGNGYERTVYLNGQPEQKSQAAEARSAAMAPQDCTVVFSARSVTVRRHAAGIVGRGHVAATAMAFAFGDAILTANQ